MKLYPSLLLPPCIVLLCLVMSCKEEKHDINIPNYFFATPSSVVLRVGTDTTVTLSGGTSPYSVISEPKANVATVAFFADTILTVHAVGTGTSRARVGDSSPSQQVLDVSIMVIPNPI